MVVLLVFGGLAGDYLFRAKRSFRTGGVEAEYQTGAALFVDKKFRTFLWAMGVAYTGLLIRCIYRIAEMAGGWGNRKFISTVDPSSGVVGAWCCLGVTMLRLCSRYIAITRSRNILLT